MASQPPARPWFRLATMAARSAPPPQPDPVPQPRPSAIRPAFRAPPTQTQEPAPQAPVSAPPPPVANTQVPPASVAPVTRSPPAAPAPVPATPPSKITTVAPPSPIVTQSPSTANRSSPVSSAPKATLAPVIPLPSSSSLPQSPKPKDPSPSRGTIYSPAPKTVSQAQTSAPKPSPYAAGSINVPATNSTSFPKPVSSQPNTPSASPINRRIVHPPSPLTLPPAQLRSDNERELKHPLEFEQKAVLVQETKEKPNLYNTEPRSTDNPHKGDRETNKKTHHKDKGSHKNTANSNSSGMRIITVAGDNKGAIMELRPHKNKDLGTNPVNFQGKFRTWGEGEKSRSGSSSSSSSEEGKSKKDGNPKEAMTKALSLPYVNSNVQAVNNSILFNATCTHHDPGVHISMSRTMSAGRGSKVKKQMNRDD
ncbi:hypothetical protein DCAR_0103136 [Daucus carota subsp. sativus]|uniref:Vegetative cell wall protein gp1-like n=1 Tax=Daucus carota subsp. sativus TaxID=79200 RepID=A0A166HSD6_DAUCS|nr:PREDICTED: extensin [Daucus carota subsp. sativus]WOG83957.1 hypothetical protein DCAR_0103136 [Daucus carota subsp. sativus]